MPYAPIVLHTVGLHILYIIRMSNCQILQCVCDEQETGGVYGGWVARYPASINCCCWCNTYQVIGSGPEGAQTLDFVECSMLPDFEH